MRAQYGSGDRKLNKSRDWRNFVSGDMDGDGKEEIVGQDVNTGTWTSLWFEEEEFVTESILTTTRAQAVRLMDYDRDEKDELVWQSLDSEEWSSLQFLDDAFASEPLNEAVAPAGGNVWVGKLPGYSVETLRAILYLDIPGLSTALSTDSLHAAELLLSWWPPMPLTQLSIRRRSSRQIQTICLCHWQTSSFGTI